ncbi:MAG: hypothetical protein ACJAYN_003044 [Bermanella sp.]|jgi:hypothetical protein
MSKKQNKLPPTTYHLPPKSYLGIGLIFGTGIGITNGPAVFGDVSINAFIVFVLSTKM